MKNTHENRNEYKCNTCDKIFVMKWRLKKHEEGHSRQNKMCHYFNNGKACPYEIVGCMFTHEKSLPCKFGERCKFDLCQFRHDISHNEKPHKSASDIETTKPNESGDISFDTEKDDVKDSENECNSGQKNAYSYSEAKNIFCDKYCADENDIHIHDTKMFKFYRGIDIQNHEYVCRCTVCRNASSFIDEHMEHFDEYHNEIDTSLSCTFHNCVYKADLPETLIQHIMRKHHK